MSLIQVILVLGSIGALVVYFVYLRSLLRDRLIAVLMFVAAILSILIPDLTTVVANMLGVGRGADLLIYLLAMGGIFALLLLTTRLSSLERTVTQLVQQTAISNARQPGRPVKSVDTDQG